MQYRTLVAGIALAAAAIGVGSTTAAASDSYRTPEPRPVGGLTTPAPKPQPSTTCEGNKQCGALRWACDIVGGTYSGWQSQDPGHDHEHGVCTWPWE